MGNFEHSNVEAKIEASKDTGPSVEGVTKLNNQFGVHRRTLEEVRNQKLGDVKFGEALTKEAEAVEKANEEIRSLRETYDFILGKMFGA